MRMIHCMLNDYSLSQFIKKIIKMSSSKMTQKAMLVRKNRRGNPKSHTDTNLRNGTTHIAVLHFTITVKLYKMSLKWFTAYS